MPPHWTTPDGEPYTAQLVVCEYMEETGLTDIKCEYRGYGEVWLMQARATYLLLEAKTSKLITRFTVDGRGVCPARLSYSNDARPTHVREDMDATEIIRTLRPYVDDGARGEVGGSGEQRGVGEQRWRQRPAATSRAAGSR
ncbi:hypothetical protein ACWDZ4_14145 [Streptomyces sp. NPDC003016]